MRGAFALVTAGLLAANVPAREPLHAGMARVGPAVYRPGYPPSPEETEIAVPAFWLDEVPATNADFLAFVRAHPAWDRGAPPRIMADDGYLADWRGPSDPGPAAPPDHPVVHVSWFAAKAYCASRGKRLPTTDEWELAASASETSPDGRDDPSYAQRILGWYSQPGSVAPGRVGAQPPNWWGVRDLHGLTWEWTLDFNSVLASGDNRENGGADALAFCGSGALRAGDKDDYAAFMRVAFRSSLRGSFTIGTLGCRCALDGDRDPADPRPGDSEPGGARKDRR